MKLTAIFAALALTATAAHADGLTSSYIEPEVEAPQRNADMYVGIFAGQSDASSEFDYEYDPHKYEETLSVGMDGSAYGAFVGWRGLDVSDQIKLGVELAHTQFGLTGGENCHNDCFHCGTGLDSATDLKAMAWIEAGSRLDLFVGAGVSRGKISHGIAGIPDATIGGNYDHSVSGYVAQVGGEYDLGKGWGLRADVTHHMFDDVATYDVPSSASGSALSDISTRDMNATTVSAAIVFNF